MERNGAARHGSFKPFADKLVRWSYSLARCQPQDEEFAKVWDVEAMQERGQQPSVVVNKICENSYGNALVFSVIHALDRPTYSSYSADSNETVPLSNPILFLPHSEFSEEEVLEFVLRDLGGVDVSAPEPEWVTDFVVPGQQEVDSEIVDLSNQIRKLGDEYERKVEERRKVREPLTLLYETGPALEESVRSVLEALGGEVEQPEDPTKKDGWVAVRVADEVLEGVLEGKGIKNRHFDWEGLRQRTD